jgi:hypothetical protein
MLLVILTGMQDSLITLLTQAITQSKTIQTGNGAVAAEEDQGRFGQILSSIISGAPQELVAADSAATISVSELLGRDPLVPALVETEIGGLLHRLTTGSYPGTETGCLNGLTTEYTAAEHETLRENPEIRSLLAGILSLVAPRMSGGSPRAGLADVSSSPVSKTFNSSASMPDEGGDIGSEESHVQDTKVMVRDDAGVMESLALLLFGALQKMTEDRQASPVGVASQDSAFTFNGLQLSAAGSKPPQAATVLMSRKQGACRAGQISKSDEQTYTTGRQHPEMEKTSVDESALGKANLLSNDLIAQSIELSAQMGPVTVETQDDKVVARPEKQPAVEERPSRENDSALVEIRRDLTSSVLLSRDKAERFLEDAIVKLNTTEGTAVNESAKSSKSGIAPVRAGDEGSTTVSFVLKGTQKLLSQGQSPNVGPLAVDGLLALDDRKTPDFGRSLEGMLTKIVPIVTGEREASSSQTDSGEKRQPRPEGHVFPGADQASSNRLTGEQNNMTLGHQAAAATVERFEKIAEQIAGKSSRHNLTMKLDIGGDENVVVGLKDFGQTVAVEVRASHQGLISLLQSQKEAIIKHLEGKEVRTNIMIDPNASGTPERRDRREGKKRAFINAPQGDEVFGRFFDTFA